MLALFKTEARHYGHLLKELLLPIVLMVDTYYRVEWFELHTTWGHTLLVAMFGGE